MTRVVQYAIAALIAAASTAAIPQDRPRHMRDLEQGGLIGVPTGEPPEMAAAAGSRFLELVSDSRQEVCYRVLLHQSKLVKGLYRLRVIDSEGKELWRCSL